MDKRAFEKDYGLNVGGKLRLFRSATVQPQPAKFNFDPVCSPLLSSHFTLSLSQIRMPDKIVIRDDLDPYSGDRVSSSPIAKKRKQHQSVLWEDPDTFPEMRAFDLEFQPDDASQFLIGSDSGDVLHCSRFGDRAVPSRYKSSQRLPGDMIGSADAKYGTRVLTLHYASVCDSRLFLAGLSDGSLNIYKTGWGTPLFTFEDFTHHPIIVARWSMQHRGVAWALDSNGFIFIFDMIEDDIIKREKPVLAHDCKLNIDGKVSYPNDFDFSYDDREPKLALSYSSGRVDLHVIADDILKGM